MRYRLLIITPASLWQIIKYLPLFLPSLLAKPTIPKDENILESITKDVELANQVATNWTYEANWKNLSLNPRGSRGVSHQASFLRSQQFHFIVFDVSKFTLLSLMSAISCYCLLLSFVNKCEHYQLLSSHFVTSTEKMGFAQLRFLPQQHHVILLSTCTKGEPVFLFGPEIGKTWQWYFISVKFCF